MHIYILSKPPTTPSTRPVSRLLEIIIRKSSQVRENFHYCIFDHLATFSALCNPQDCNHQRQSVLDRHFDELPSSMSLHHDPHCIDKDKKTHEQILGFRVVV